MKNQDILMVLPKHTIQHPSEMSRDWEVDKDGAGITIYTRDRLLGHADWREARDFGFKRPAIKLTLPSAEDEMAVFTSLVSRLVMAYEMMPSRYPLYIRLPKEHTSLIAAAARLGFVPYFGEWSESSRDQSEKTWEGITDNLRKEFPETAFLQA